MSDEQGAPPQEAVGAAAARETARRIREQMAKVIVGQDDTVELLLTALLCGGHVLLEGPPGTAKTLTALCFARAMGVKFGRIQFTPDLMPGDIVGSSVFNFQTSSFSHTRGPIFCDLLLADEINRTPPKTQAALLEAMQERSVTLDGVGHALGDRFMVVATQNPIEQQGTYPLPEAQLDRFLFKQLADYPSADEELAIVQRYSGFADHAMASDYGIEAVASPADIEAAVQATGAILLSEPVARYAVSLVRATRQSADFETGASPRAAAMLAAAARARAVLHGRDYVIPDDVKALALPALRHRVILSPSAEIEGRKVDQALLALIESVEVPR